MQAAPVHLFSGRFTVAGVEQDAIRQNLDPLRPTFGDRVGQLTVQRLRHSNGEAKLEHLGSGVRSDELEWRAFRHDLGTVHDHEPVT